MTNISPGLFRLASALANRLSPRSKPGRSISHAGLRALMGPEGGMQDEFAMAQRAARPGGGRTLAVPAQAQALPERRAGPPHHPDDITNNAVAPGAPTPVLRDPTTGLPKDGPLPETADFHRYDVYRTFKEPPRPPGGAMSYVPQYTTAAKNMHSEKSQKMLTELARQGHGPSRMLSKEAHKPSVFVIHQTAGENPLGVGGFRSYKGNEKGHLYIFEDGSTRQVVPYEEKARATRTEIPRENRYTVGRNVHVPIGNMTHIEVDYENRGQPNEAQYQQLANEYIRSSQSAGRYQAIIPHSEIDRGIRGGHQDPQNFDYNHFYDILREKGVPIDDIPHFDHTRLWGGNDSEDGNPAYPVPHYDENHPEQHQWPSVLTGVPLQPKKRAQKRIPIPWPRPSRNGPR